MPLGWDRNPFWCALLQSWSLKLQTCLEDGVNRFLLGVSGHQSRILLFGQFLSLCLASTGAASTTLARRCGVSAPTAQSGLVYALLSLHLLALVRRTPCHERGEHQTLKQHNVCVSLRRSDDSPVDQTVYTSDALAETVEATHNGCGEGYGDKTRRDQEFQTFLPPPPPMSRSPSFPNFRLRAPCWVYFIIALFDLESNYLTVLAFRYTSFTSISLFESLAIPSAMISSCFLLGRVYGLRHFVGVALCLFGLASNLLSDLEDTIDASPGFMNDDGVSRDSARSVWGDVLAITGACAYGLNDTLYEFSIKSFDRVEFLGMLGFFGTGITVLQLAVLSDERKEAAKFLHTDGLSCEPEWGIMVLVFYVMSLCVFYVGVSHFLVIGDAAVLTLSLLSTNLWALLFSILSQRIVPPPLFFVALVFVVTGVVVYETGPSTAAGNEFTKASGQGGTDADTDPESSCIVGGSSVTYGSVNIKRIVIHDVKL